MVNIPMKTKTKKLHTQDSCNAPDSLEDEPSSEAIVQYELFRDALKATGRPVYLALSGWHNWYSPYGQSLANSWRIGYDVRNWMSAWHLGAERKNGNQLTPKDLLVDNIYIYIMYIYIYLLIQYVYIVYIYICI